MFINRRKLKAAAGSMHQFCQEVREMFPGAADDAAVEAATYYIYMNMARDVFGARFAGTMGRSIRSRLKYTTASEIRQRLGRINRRAEARDKAIEKVSQSRSVEEKCRSHVTSVIKALLAEGGYHGDDPETVSLAYARFEELVRDMKRHMTGIKEQNHFVLNTAARD